MPEDTTNNAEEQLRVLEALLERLREAASACTQYAAQTADEPYLSTALPGLGPFQVVLRNDPQAGTSVRRLQGNALELKAAASMIVAALSQGSDATAAAICREIEGVVAATNQQQRDAARTAFTGRLDEDFPRE